MIRYLPESQLNCDSSGMPPMAIGSQAPPTHGYRQPSDSGTYRRMSVAIRGLLVVQGHSVKTSEQHVRPALDTEVVEHIIYKARGQPV
jgi:hypothetical protein